MSPKSNTWRVGKGPKSDKIEDVVHALRTRTSRKIGACRGGLVAAQNRAVIEPWDTRHQRSIGNTLTVMKEWGQYLVGLDLIEGTILPEWRQLKKLGGHPHLVVDGPWLVLMPEGKKFGSDEEAVKALVQIHRKMRLPRV